MRCVACGDFSWTALCSTCKQSIKPKLNKREIKEDFFVYSFFGYNDISPLLHTKHQPVGVYIYKFLAKEAFKYFFETLNSKENFTIIPIDDRVKGGYSHTAVLAKAIELKNVKAKFGTLRAKNKVSYSGKSLNYRKSNPRNFTCKLKNEENIILLDDLVTTGTTLLEALHVMKKTNLFPLFALTLADAKVK